MLKKLGWAMVVMALGAAVPSMAHASTGLTQGGAFIKVGSAVSNVSTNMVVTSSIGNLTCAKAEVPTSLSRNNGSEGVEAIGAGEGTTSSCFYKGTTSVAFTDLTWNPMTSNIANNGTGTLSLSFKADLPGGVVCTYSATAAPFTYAVGGGVITFTNAALVASPAFCGTAKLDASWVLTVGGGTVVFM